MLSYTEENYLKAIFHLSENGQDASTNAISEALNTKPASVSDMLKKLSKKKVINYQKYKPIEVSDMGRQLALQIIRKHRLWEVFLVEKLQFQWDEVHEIAEQLEHIQSHILIQRLDKFLGFPAYDPHGDPIPNEKGEMKAKERIPLSELEEQVSVTIVGLKETSAVFLQFLDKTGIYLGAKIKILEKMAFDSSQEIEIDNKKVQIISNEVAKNIFVAK